VVVTLSRLSQEFTQLKAAVLTALCLTITHTASHDTKCVITCFVRGPAQNADRDGSALVANGQTPKQHM